MSYLDIVFEKIIDKTLKNEGGYVNDPSDSGGETKYGISKKSYPDLDIKNLTIADAKAIYKRDYFDKLPLTYFSNDDLIYKLFDISVNAGIKKAITLLQRALRAQGFSDVVDDGIMGDVTRIACAKVAYTDRLLASLKSEQAGEYRYIVAINPKKAKFLNGWLKRAYSA